MSYAKALQCRGYCVNPTYSFKGRVVSVAITKAREFGFDTLARASAKSKIYACPTPMAFHNLNKDKIVEEAEGACSLVEFLREHTKDASMVFMYKWMELKLMPNLIYRASFAP